MTKEDIKDTYSMRDIAMRYDLQPNRSGFISCPFHSGDREPSLKLYEKDFHCHSCGENGDIFTFVQLMDDVSFKEAFQILGGVYEKPTFSSRMAVYKARKKREMAQKEQRRQADRRWLNSMLISIYRAYMERSEPFSYTWTDCYNRLQYQLYIMAELNGTEAR